MKRLLAAAVFVGSILTANLLVNWFGLVPIWFGLLVPAGTFAAGAALVARDAVQETGGRRGVVLLIVTGAGLSWWLGDGRIAIASGLAFLVSELVDMAVYTPLRARSRALAVVASSAVAAPVDTLLFLWRSGLDVTVSAVAGQFIVKTALAAVAAVVLAGWGRRRAVSRDTV